MNSSDPNKERLWRHIESNIKTDGLYCEHHREALNNEIQNLPGATPHKDLWSVLEKDIIPFKPEPRSRKLYRYSSRVAATIVLFVASILIYQHVFKKESEEVLYASQEESVEIFLSRICSINPPKCNEVGFIELRSEIVDLCKEKSEVRNSIFANPTDEDINKVNERIEKQIGNLKSQLIDYVD